MPKFLLFLLILGLHQHIKAQSKIQPAVAGYLAMDAEGVYIGPAFLLGLEKQKKKTFFGLSLHYFRASVNNPIFQDTGIIRMASANLYVKSYLLKGRLQKLYTGMGVSYQYRYENYKGISFVIDNEQRRYITLCYIIGYTLSNLVSSKPALHIELFGTGPYHERTTSVSYAELLTQLGIGLKMNF